MLKNDIIISQWVNKPVRKPSTSARVGVQRREHESLPDERKYLSQLIAQ